MAILSVFGHGALVAGLVYGQPNSTPPVEDPPAMTVVLTSPWVPPPPEPVPPRPLESKTREAPAAKRRPVARPARHPAIAPTMLAEAPGPTMGLGESQLAGAATVGTGQSDGAGCNMLRRLQQALRKDHRVLAAVRDADPDGALMVWDGDWVRHPGQDGAGLAAVREAILWEVGFAPPDCRYETVRGLVIVSLGDSPGAARLALGSGSWRWRDLLFAGARKPAS